MIEDWLAENYEAIVADPGRPDTFDSIAQDAEVNGSPGLAAWARKRAAESGKKVTPEKASAAPKSTRAKGEPSA